MWACFTFTYPCKAEIFGSNWAQKEPEEAVHSHAAEEIWDFLDGSDTDSCFPSLGSHRCSKWTFKITYDKSHCLSPLLDFPVVFKCPTLVYSTVHRWFLPKSALEVLHSYTSLPCLDAAIRNSFPQHQKHTKEIESKLLNISEMYSKSMWSPAKKHQQNKKESRWKGR